MDISHEELEATRKQCLWTFRKLGGVCYPYPHMHRCSPGDGPNDCHTFLVFPPLRHQDTATAATTDSCYRGAICCKYGKYLRPGTFHIEQDDGIYDLLTGDLIADSTELEFTGADTREEQAKRKFYHNQVVHVGNHKVEQLRQEVAEMQERKNRMTKKGLATAGGKWSWKDLLGGPSIPIRKPLVTPSSPPVLSTATTTTITNETTTKKMTREDAEKRAKIALYRFLRRGPLLSTKPDHVPQTLKQVTDAHVRLCRKEGRPVDILEILSRIRTQNLLEWHPYPLTDHEIDACVRVAVDAWEKVADRFRTSHFADHCIGCLQLLSTHGIKARTGEVLFPVVPVLQQFIQPLFAHGKGIEQRGFNQKNVAIAVKTIRDVLVESGERIALPVVTAAVAAVE